VLSSAVFRLPTDGSIYADSIFTRCRELIGYDLWSGLQRHRLDAWITNFRTPEERYLAARVLDSLIYRSDAQTISLMRQLFSRVLPDCAREHRLSPHLQGCYLTLRGTGDPRVRIVPVIPPNSPPTKSGPTIARHLKRALRFNDDWIIYPHDVPGQLGNADVFVFVDDFLGTGTQFNDFLADTGLAAYVSSCCFIYGSLAAHTLGMSNLRIAFPDLHVATVEKLDDSHALFHDTGGSFPDELNSCETAKQFYYDLLDDRGLHIVGPDRRGFGHFEIAYAFEHAVPDNSLPILWWDESSQWRPLFDR
jgi:hypothetical protein